MKDRSAHFSFLSAVALLLLPLPRRNHGHVKQKTYKERKKDEKSVEQQPIEVGLAIKAGGGQPGAENNREKISISLFLSFFSTDDDLLAAVQRVFSFFVRLFWSVARVESPEIGSLVCRSKFPQHQMHAVASKRKWTKIKRRKLDACLKHLILEWKCQKALFNEMYPSTLAGFLSKSSSLNRAVFFSFDLQAWDPKEVDFHRKNQSKARISIRRTPRIIIV